jgi:hypothetical protein
VLAIVLTLQWKMEESVPELKVWKLNLLSIPEYYHKSAVRTKELNKVLPTMKAFPTSTMCGFPSI